MRAAIVSAFLVWSLSAQAIQTMDRSTARTRTKYYVIFAVRGGSATGHAFVLWGTEDSVHKRSTIKAYGLYPKNDKDGCSSAFRKVPGAVVDESLNHGVTEITDELIVKVDRADFERSMKVARLWQCKREFELLNSDCVEFLRAVGESLGMDMPPRTFTRWTPRAYVRALLAGAAT